MMDPEGAHRRSDAMTRLLPLAALPLLLAACAPMMPAEPVPEGGTCGADALAAEYVGRDASALFATTFTIPVRFIRPGDVVTLDFVPDRANFDIDANEIVTGVRCG